MSLYYLSDLHISSMDESIGKYLKNFLQTVPKPGDTVVFGGDVFDLFLGDKLFFQNKFSSLLREMESLAQSGCNVYYLEGNHDFHMKGVFSAVTLKTDSFLLLWENKKIWIAHGDSINKKDYSYRFWRFFTRSWLAVLLIRALPGGWLSSLGSYLKKSSHKYNDISRLPLDKISFVKKIFRNYAEEKIKKGFHLVLLGHSHIEDNHEVQTPSCTGQYVNLGFSHKALLYAVCDTGSEKILTKKISG